MNDLLRRQRALERTAARFRPKKFAWGSADCVALAKFHIKAMGLTPPPVPRYRSPIGARRALAQTGFATLEALLNARLVRIAPAAALPGDLVMLAGEAPFGALTISVGQKLLGWHEEAETPVIIAATEAIGAWRL